MSDMLKLLAIIVAFGACFLIVENAFAVDYDIYIDTDVAAGGDGTIGNPFNTCASAVSGTTKSGYVAGDTITFNFTGSAVDTAYCLVNGFESADVKKIFAGDGTYHINGIGNSGDKAIQLQDPNVVIQDMILSGTINGVFDGDTWLIRNEFRGGTTGKIFDAASSINYYVINNTFLNITNGTGDFGGDAGIEHVFYNNTIVGTGANVSGGGAFLQARNDKLGDTYIKNNVCSFSAMGTNGSCYSHSGTDNGNGKTGFSNNFCTDGFSSFVCSELTDITFDAVGKVVTDDTVNATIDGGVNLSADAAYAFDFEKANETRNGTWDAGAWDDEISAPPQQASFTLPPPFLNE